ncbi:MAG: hemolysin III family protein [Thiovulaceae bacterium]|nr:hemolysin III family protein [Sulfurimonadaceae bacterium]
MKNDVNGYSLIEEIWHAISHGIGLALSIAGLTIMVTFAAMSGSVIAVVSSAIFGATLIILYGSSTLYHAITHHEIKQRFQQFDHASIYLLIAGSYTPITLVSLGGAWGWSIFALVWSIAVIGITITFVYPGRSEKLSLFLYITMGWIIVIAIKPLLENMESGGLWLLLAGGFSYSVGVLFYVWEKLPFNHAIWHLFVLGGSILHFFMVLLYII